jgi:hypothetical protein
LFRLTTLPDDEAAVTVVTGEEVEAQRGDALEPNGRARGSFRTSAGTQIGA